MVASNMDSAERRRVLALLGDKDELERQIRELTLVLETNNVGMNDPLVDGDGYPRSDIDVFQVRHARHRILCLQNDHKALMKQIEKGLQNLHSRVLGTSSHNDNTAMDTSDSSHHNNIANMETGNGSHHSVNAEDAVISGVVRATNNLRVQDMKAIVKVNFVSERSPADTAGIKVNDEILQFGSITSDNFRQLSQIGEVVQHSVGSRLTVKLRRGADVLITDLTPGPWSGRGLLGCNIVPV